MIFALFSKPPPLPPFNNPIPEQAFLAKNYDENAKKPDRDPRGAFRNPADIGGAAAGIVGPLGSSTFSLPNVERALSEMEVGIGGTPAPIANTTDTNTTRRPPTGRPVGTGTRPAGLATLGASTNVPPTGRPPASPTPIVGLPSPTGGQTQHEVLQNFFQSLLSSKDRAGASRGGPVPKTNGNGSGTEDGST